MNGIFPNHLKYAKIKPLFKKDDHSLIENYRPISLLPAISKVIEKIVHKQLYYYLVKHKLLFNSQYGYRKQHSTEHAAIELIDRLHIELERKKIPIAIFLDLSKAFDSIDHDILIEKLYKYGLSERAVKWFGSFFCQLDFNTLNTIPNCPL